MDKLFFMTLFSYLQELLINLKKHKGVRRYSANTGWMLAERGVQMMTTFIVGIYIARKLGPENYGLLNYAIYFSSLFSFFVLIGFDQIVVRELVKRPKDRDRLLGTALVFRLTGFVLMLVAVGVTLTLSTFDNITRIMIVIISIGFLGQAFFVVDFYFQAEVKVKYTSMAIITSSVIVAAVNLWGIWYNSPLVFFACTNAAGSFFPACLKLYAYSSTGAFLHTWRFCMGEMFFLIKESWSLFINTIAGLIIGKAVFLQINAMLNITDVGYYSVAIRLLEIWCIFPEIVVTSLFPAIIKTSQVDNTLYEIRMQRFYFVLFWSGCAASVLTMIFARSLINVLYGPAYSPSAIVLTLAAAWFPSMAVWVLFTRWCINESLQQLLMWITIFGALNVFVLNWFFIKVFGLAGAALTPFVATLCSWILICVCSNAGLRQVKLILKSLYRIRMNTTKIGG